MDRGSDRVQTRGQIPPLTPDTSANPSAPLWGHYLDLQSLSSYAFINFFLRIPSYHGYFDHKLHDFGECAGIPPLASLRVLSFHSIPLSIVWPGDMETSNRSDTLILTGFKRDPDYLIGVNEAPLWLQPNLYKSLLSLVRASIKGQTVIAKNERLLQEYRCLRQSLNSVSQSTIVTVYRTVAPSRVHVALDHLIFEPSFLHLPSWLSREIKSDHRCLTYCSPVGLDTFGALVHHAGIQPDVIWDSLQSHPEFIAIVTAAAKAMSPTNTEDLRQAVLLALTQRIASTKRFLGFDPSKGHLRPFLSKVIKLESLHHATRQKLHDIPSADADVIARSTNHVSSSVESPDGLAAKFELQQAIVSALVDLPQLERSIVVRRFYHAETLREIAAATNLPESTVRNKINQSLRILGNIFSGNTLSTHSPVTK